MTNFALLQYAWQMFAPLKYELRKK
jgi:hypothetical protein